MAGTQLPYSRTVLTRHQALTTANLAKLNAINDLAKSEAEQVNASVSADALTAASDNTTNTTPPAAPRAQPAAPGAEPTAHEDFNAANLRRWLAIPSGKPPNIILAF